MCTTASADPCTLSPVLLCLQRFDPMVLTGEDGEARMTLEKRARTIAQNQQVRKERPPSSKAKTAANVRDLHNNEKTKNYFQKKQLDKTHTTFNLATDHPTCRTIRFHRSVVVHQKRHAPQEQLSPVHPRSGSDFPLSRRCGATAAIARTRPAAIRI